MWLEFRFLPISPNRSDSIELHLSRSKGICIEKLKQTFYVRSGKILGRRLHCHVSCQCQTGIVRTRNWHLCFRSQRVLSWSDCNRGKYFDLSCPLIAQSSKAVYRPIEVVKQSTAQKLKGRILDSINKDNKQKEKDPNIIGGGFLPFSFIWYVVVMFRVYDTPFCFLNTIHDKQHNLHSVVLLKDDSHDVATQFNHLFWFGIINKEVHST